MTLPSLLTSGLALVLVLVFLVWYRRAPGAIYAILNFLAISLWPLGTAFERLSTSVQGEIFWGQIQFVGISLVPFTWFLYLANYTGHLSWLTWKRLAWLSLGPGISVALVLTNSYHHLMWAPQVFTGPGLLLHRVYAPGILVTLVSSFHFTLGTLLLLHRVLPRVHGRSRAQVWTLIILTGLPWLAAPLELLGSGLYAELFAQPIALLTGLLAAVWNLLRYRIGDLVPLAREVILENLVDAVIVLDSQKSIVDLNPAALKIFSGTRAVWLREPVERMWPEYPFQTDPPGLFPASYRWIKAGATYDVRLSAILTNPEERLGWVVVLRDITAWVATHAALREAHDDLEKRVEVRTLELTETNAELHKEILERHQAEEALRESEIRYRSLIETSPDIVTLVDRTGRLLMINRMGVSSFGYERADELLGKSALELIAPEGHPAALQILEQVLVHGVVRNAEFQHVRKDGSFFAAETSASLLKDETGNSLGFVCFTRDISERKQAERALRESEERFRQLVDNIDGFFWLFDVHRNEMIYFSQAFEKVTGRAFGRVEDGSKAWFEAVHPDDKEQLFATFQASLVNRDPIPLDQEYRIYHADGSIRWLWSRAFVMKNDIGEVYRLGGFTKDITDRIKVRETLCESLKEKEVLLKEIHHRVKNNLQVISSLLSLQSSKVSDPEVIENLRDSQTRVRSMAMIHEKLYQSNNLAGVDFGEYLCSLVAYLFSTYDAARRGVRLVYEVDEIHLEIDAAVPCGLILNELVSNALKHAFPDEIRGEVCIELKRIDPSRVRLVVADNGAGFPAGLNFRETSSLGLQLVCSLVEQLGGSVELKNGAGARFEIEFASAENDKR